MKGDLLYLTNISDCLAQIESYTQSGRDSFLASRMAQDAVIRNLEIFGEATKRLSPGLREKHADLPWRQMAGLRDVLIHDYARVDAEEVWGIVERDLPALQVRIEAMLQAATD